MKHVPEFVAFVDDAGAFAFDDPKAVKAHYQQYAGREVVVTIQPRRRQRSLEQNRYWWAVPVPILAEHCGYTASQMHYALLGECFGYLPGPNGQPLPVKPSSSELTVQEFMHLIEWVQTWAMSELGCYVPSPNEVVTPDPVGAER